MRKTDAAGAKQILQIVSAFRASRVLITASRYRLFDLLERPRSASAAAKVLRLDTRATEILLDALVSTGLIRKDSRNYRNTEAASSFLVTGAPLYLGDIVSHYGTLWKRWSDLDSVVKTGKPATGPFDHDSFIMGMHNLATIKAPDVLAAIDLTGVRKALDLGGGPGTYSLGLARKGVEVTLFDLPETIAVARKVVSSEGVQKVRFAGGDFMTDDIGSGYDLVLISQILHSYSRSDNVTLLRKARKALGRGGTIAIHEFLLSEDHTQPPQGAFFSVNMLVNTVGGRSYSPSEIVAMLIKARFTSPRETALEDTVLIQAQKGP